MRIIRFASIAVAALVLLAVGYGFYMERIVSPRVVRELIAHPAGDRAQRVMLITLPSGRRFPSTTCVRTTGSTPARTAAGGRSWSEAAPPSRWCCAARR